MADWKDVMERVEALQTEKEGLKFRLAMKDKEIARLSRALELLHGDLPVFTVERPALVVVR